MTREELNEFMKDLVNNNHLLYSEQLIISPHKN